MYLSIYLCIYLFVCLSVYLPTYLPIEMEEGGSVEAFTFGNKGLYTPRVERNKSWQEEKAS